MMQANAQPSVSPLVPGSTPSTIEWHWKTFDALTPHELHAVLAARCAVFIMEQQCIYADIDGLDPAAWHLFGRDTSQAEQPLAAYARVFGPDAGDSAVRIGRVLTAPAYRKLGLGKILIDRAMLRVPDYWPQTPIRLHAQAHLQEFYGLFGFIPTSEIHLEDEIPHVWMQRECVAVRPYVSIVRTA
jgi:ElaA protein